jgi:hypothetical protein
VQRTNTTYDEPAPEYEPTDSIQRLLFSTIEAKHKYSGPKYDYDMTERKQLPQPCPVYDHERIIQSRNSPSTTEVIHKGGSNPLMSQSFRTLVAYHQILDWLLRPLRGPTTVAADSSKRSLHFAQQHCLESSKKTESFDILAVKMVRLIWR